MNETKDMMGGEMSREEMMAEAAKDYSDAYVAFKKAQSYSIQCEQRLTVARETEDRLGQELVGATEDLQLIASFEESENPPHDARRSQNETDS